MRQQLVDAGGRVRVDAHQHVADIGDRIEAVGFARRHERVEPCEVLATLLVADEEEVLPAEGDDAERTLRLIVVNGDPDVVEEARQVLPLIERAVDRLAERTLGWMPGCSSRSQHRSRSIALRDRARRSVACSAVRTIPRAFAACSTR